MQTQKINGIVLSVSKYKDYDALATVLTENGTRKIKFTGVRRPKAKFAFAAQPFCCAEFLLSGANDYAVVMGVVEDVSLFELAQNYEVFEMASNMLKIANKIATDETFELYYTLRVSLLSLKEEGMDTVAVDCYFKAKILNILGIFDGNSKCASCGKNLENGALLDEETGALYCKNCASQNCTPVSGNVVQFASRCATSMLSQVLAKHASEGVKTQAQKLLTKMLKIQL